MAVKWEAVEVAKLATRTATGPFGSAISSKYFLEAGVPVIRGSNLSQDVSSRLVDEGLVFVNEEKAKEFSRSEARKGDLVFTCWGTIDQVGLIDDRARYDRYIVSNKQMLLTPDPSKADSLFLYYYFSSPGVRTEIVNQGIGSSVPGFNLGQLRVFKVLLPPLVEQKSIASVLGALDDKIESNRRMNVTLEAMSWGLFRSWFVDFDPVVTKVEGRSAVHLDEATLALFPAEFKDSAIGRVPSSWEFCSLGSRIDLLSGGTPKTSVPDYWDGAIPWYSVKDAPSGSNIWVSETEKNITQLGIENSATRILPEKTTIISARGTVGKLALTSVPMAMNQSCYGIRGREGLTEFFTYFLMQSAVSQIQQHTHGTVFDTITRQTFDNIHFCFPPAQLTAVFDRAVEPFLLRIRANLFQSRTLSALRDTLLPRLLSGEMRIPDAPTGSL